MPNVDAVIKSARTGVAQSILALGDRRVADALEIAVERRMDFKRAVRDAGLDPGFYLFRGRGRDEGLPWDVVDTAARPPRTSSPSCCSWCWPRGPTWGSAST